MHSQYIATRFGFVVDYLAEVFKALREVPVAHILDRHYRLGGSLNRRDEKAVRRTVSGLLKLLHPDEQATKEEVEQYVALAIEMRRRVKEQLKRMGGIEFWDTHFSYIDVETSTEKAVGVPEQTAAGLISGDLLPSGVVYTAGAEPNRGKAGLFRVEVAATKGGSGYAVTGSGSRAVRESVRTAYDYLRTHWHELAVERPLEGHTLNVQVVDLQHAEEVTPSSMALAVAIVSQMLDRPVVPGTVILGDITVAGGTLSIVGFADCLQVVSEQGARRVLIPIQNSGELTGVPPEILNRIDVAFYSNPRDAVLKALGL